MRIRKKVFVLQLILYTQRARECRQTCFLLKFNLSHKLQLLNVQHSFCSVMCYTVLIWTSILLTLGNTILYNHFNWPKPVHYVATDKINVSIRIRIQQISKVKIRIRWMWILTSFVTSLVQSLACSDPAVSTDHPMSSLYNCAYQPVHSTSVLKTEAH